MATANLINYENKRKELQNRVLSEIKLKGIGNRYLANKLDLLPLGVKILLSRGKLSMNDILNIAVPIKQTFEFHDWTSKKLNHMG